MDKYLKKILMNTGGALLEEDKKPKETDAIYGNVFGYKGEPPTDWRPYLPDFEDQKRTAFCTNYSYCNVMEMKAKKKSIDVNFSDRHLGVISNTTHKGNSLSRVCEVARKKGLIKEEHCQWEPEWVENPVIYWNSIQDINDVPEDAKRYLGPNYSRVRPYPQQIKQALAYSPIYAGAYIGSTWENNTVSYPKNVYCGHAFVIAYADDEYYYVFDSLGRQLKKLSISYPIIVSFAFRKLPENWKTLNMSLKRILLNGKEQFVEKDKDIHRIPDEKTLSLLLSLGWVSKEETPVSSLEGYQECIEIPSVVLNEKMKEVMPVLEDALKSAEELKSGKPISNEKFNLIKWIKKIISGR